MRLFDTLTLFVIMITLAAIPSTSVALVVVRSATMNLANGIAASIGIVLGDLFFVVLAKEYTSVCYRLCKDYTI